MLWVEMLTKKLYSIQGLDVQTKKMRRAVNVLVMIKGDNGLVDLKKYGDEWRDDVETGNSSLLTMPDGEADESQSQRMLKKKYLEVVYLLMIQTLQVYSLIKLNDEVAEVTLLMKTLRADMQGLYLTEYSQTEVQQRTEQMFEITFQFISVESTTRIDMLHK